MAESSNANAVEIIRTILREADATGFADTSNAAVVLASGQLKPKLRLYGTFFELCCPLCSVRFLNGKRYREHFDNDTDRPTTCARGLEAFKNAERLRAAVEAARAEERASFINHALRRDPSPPRTQQALNDQHMVSPRGVQRPPPQRDTERPQPRGR